MEGSDFLLAGVLCLFAAVAAVPLASRLGIGAVLGYLLAAYCSYRFSSTNFRLYASSSSIIAAFSFHRTGVYWITASSSVASSLKITGRNPSLQLQMATPGRPIQSP